MRSSYQFRPLPVTEPFQQTLTLSDASAGARVYRKAWALPRFPAVRSPCLTEDELPAAANQGNSSATYGCPK